VSYPRTPSEPIRSDTGPIRADELAPAVAAANIPALIATLYQLSGDKRWLAAPYAPARTRGLEAHDSGGIAPERQAEVRAAAEGAIRSWLNGAEPAVPAPTGAELVHLMSICMGEPVSDEYEPMMAEEMGFRPAHIRSVPPPLGRQLSVVIIGAGVSGLVAGIQLRAANIPFVILERNLELGGTWFENRYPGCGVDVPSGLYSLSSFPGTWNRYFAQRDDVHAYLVSVAREFDIARHIRFGVEVSTATWDEAVRRWQIRGTDRNGDEVCLDPNILITATGQLNRPRVPMLPGAETFTGPQFHTARWPGDLDLTGKRVAVVGTGASAMQVVPAIAGQVSELLIFQRSPQWIAPSREYFREITTAEQWLLDNIPYYRGWTRFRLAWAFNDKVHSSLQIDPAWPTNRASINSENDAHRRVFTRYLMEQLEGRPDLVEKALPHYPPFGKRMLLDNGWFKALRRPNVELITRPVVALTPDGVRDSDDSDYPVDVVVYATGFDAQNLLEPLTIHGRPEASLREIWGPNDARAYLGLTTPGFPNLFFMYGPNTNLGHGGSWITLAECQGRYIVDLLCSMLERGIAVVECKPEVCDTYNRDLDEAHRRMIWTDSRVDTWYRNTRGRVVTNSPWRVVDYWRMTYRARLADYLLTPAGSPIPARRMPSVRNT
jgi:4-hydroxyacetophenone monooxygenase